MNFIERMFSEPSGIILAVCIVLFLTFLLLLLKQNREQTRKEQDQKRFSNLPRKTVQDIGDIQTIFVHQWVVEQNGYACIDTMHFGSKEKQFILSYPQGKLIPGKTYCRDNEKTTLKQVSVLITPDGGIG